MVVFDGIDEVTQIPKRVELVQRIQQFSAAYPACSIIVTTREVGYPRAALDEQVFGHYRLEEFSPAQVGTYAHNWFQLVGRPELLESFLRDSERVTDLRSNPLMLSLLCILFRARSAIPRRRREIYSRCADLLFHRWDAQRQIEQPEELPTYGDRLMQEIARWFFTSTSAQAGLGEQVLVKVISNYLVAAGAPEGDARRRAEDFLEFCSVRAWLLAFIGTGAAGERLFAFTHRTFYEYFAAEALSRQAKHPDTISDTVISCHRRDSTSVLPELLIQAYEDKEDRGGSDVFEGLLLRQWPSRSWSSRAPTVA